MKVMVGVLSGYVAATKYSPSGGALKPNLDGRRFERKRKIARVPLAAANSESSRTSSAMVLKEVRASARDHLVPLRARRGVGV